jgi:hypothetical protein
MSETARLVQYCHLESKINPKPIVPKFWAMRFDNVLSTSNQQSIRNSWESMMSLEPKAYVNDTDERRHTKVDQRDTFHIGSWKRSSRRPFYSADLLQKGNARKQEGILNFTGTISKLCQSVVQPRIYQWDPVYFQQTAHCALTTDDYLQQNRIDPDAWLKAIKSSGCDNPLLFGGLASMLAATTGQSETPHLDKSDGAYTIVIVCAPTGFGDEDLPFDQQWGQIEFPQLGYRMPLRPGQILAFQANYILHSATPLPFTNIDRRLVLTLFTCAHVASWVMAHGGQWRI